MKRFTFPPEFKDLEDFCLGFGPTFTTLRRVATEYDNLNGNYPPYDLIKIDNENFKLVLALAGFEKDEISVQLNRYDKQLIVSGNINKKEKEGEYIHPGIAKRDFCLKLPVDNTGVLSCEFKNGLLTICLQKVIPEEQKPIDIEIK